MQMCCCEFLTNINIKSGGKVNLLYIIDQCCLTDKKVWESLKYSIRIRICVYITPEFINPWVVF